MFKKLFGLNKKEDTTEVVEERVEAEIAEETAKDGDVAAEAEEEQAWL